MSSRTIEILSELVKIDSRFCVSNKNIVEYVVDLLKEKADNQIYSYSHNGVEYFNLVSKIKGKKSDRPKYLIGHTDTVNICNGWNSDPFSPTINDNYLIGLGASDMKGAIACFISAILEGNIPEQDIYMLLDADEEGEGTGGRELIKQIAINKGEFIIGEPTDLNLRLGQRSMVTLEVTTTGESAHAGSTSKVNNEANNAIYKAVRAINALIDDENRIDKIKDDVYGSAIQNIGTITGGNSSNVIPDKCCFTVERRFPPSINLQEETDLLVSMLHKNDITQIKQIFWGASFQTSPHGKLVQSLQSLDSNIKLSPTGQGWTEAALFRQFGECIIFGPGDPVQAHKPNEHININSLENYTNIIKSWLFE